MLAPLLATLFFSLSVIFAARSAAILGGGLANLGRIVAATALLAIWAHTWGGGLAGPAFPWFFLSGVIGFGLGDMGLFGAITRIGPRLAILLTQCLAAPIAAVTEWAWLGTTLTAGEVGCALWILAGVALALAPDNGWEGSRSTFWTGVLFGAGSAFGQAFGAVVSRKANLVAAGAGMTLDGGTAAYQRVIGGLLMTLVAWLIVRHFRPTPVVAKAQLKRGIPFVLLNALAGPTIGVGCYQWSLRTTPSGIVLPIIATSPLVTVLISWLLDGSRPTRRALLGSIVAVAGAVQLARLG